MGERDVFGRIVTPSADGFRQRPSRPPAEIVLLRIASGKDGEFDVGQVRQESR